MNKKGYSIKKPKKTENKYVELKFHTKLTVLLFPSAAKIIKDSIKDTGILISKIQ